MKRSQKIIFAAAATIILVGLLNSALRESENLSEVSSVSPENQDRETPNASEIEGPASELLRYEEQTSQAAAAPQKEEEQQENQEDRTKNQTNQTFTRARFAGIAETTQNHVGDNLEDLEVVANYPAFTEVRTESMLNLMIDRGGNNSVSSPGTEDITIESATLSVDDSGSNLVVDPDPTPDYRLQEEDRVIVRFRDFLVPTNPEDEIIGFEINSRNTNQTLEPTEVSLRYQN